MLKNSIDNLLTEVRQRRLRLESNNLGSFPMKKLRNTLISSMCIDVACQPAQVDSLESFPMRNEKLRRDYEVKLNPIWDVAPKGAFYKSRKICSLITDVIRCYNGTNNISHDLVRLSINIWNMSKGHFDGLCRRIRRKLRKTILVFPRKSPEALKGFEALIRNPYHEVRVYRYSRYWKCRHIAGFSTLRVSRKLELVLESLRCTKCTAKRVFR